MQNMQSDTRDTLSEIGDMQSWMQQRQPCVCFNLWHFTYDDIIIPGTFLRKNFPLERVQKLKSNDVPMNKKQLLDILRVNDEAQEKPQEQEKLQEGRENIDETNDHKRRKRNANRIESSFKVHETQAAENTTKTVEIY